MNYSVGALEEAKERQVEEFVLPLPAHHISQKQVEARTCWQSSAPDKRRYMQRYAITYIQMQRLTLSLTCLQRATAREENTKAVLEACDQVMDIDLLRAGVRIED